MAIYQIQNDCLTVTASDAGAELQSIKGADGTEYLWQADPAIWSGKAPNIFPYVARLVDKTYTVNGKEYHMEIHGLIKSSVLTVEKQTEESITFLLISNEETKERYPFDFAYRITYTLKENQLVITTSVENRGEERMYFAVGGHPGFCVPLEPGLSFEDYYLEFDRPSRPYRVGFTAACFLTGKDMEYPLEEGRRIPLRHDLFDDDAIVLKHAPKQVKIASRKGARSVTVSYPDFPYIGFWHMPKKEAPYVCIEPWSSLPARDGIIEDFACQSDLIGLEGRKTHETTWMVELN